MVALAGLTVAAAWAEQTQGAFLFGTPKNLGPQVNSSDSEFDPTVSADGLELYFQSPRAGGYGPSDIYVSKRASTSDDWGEAVNLGPVINTENGESGVSLSADGLTLYFNSNRPGGSGGADLYASTRASRSEPWGPPANLGPVVNSEYNEINACPWADGLTLYFSEAEGAGYPLRPGGLGQSDLWMTTRASASAPWTTPVNLGSVINTNAVEGAPFITRDGLVLFFNSDRPGGLGQWDIWYSTRKSTKDPWGKPANLGAPVNTASWDGNAELSADGRTLYFSSSRGGGSGLYDLWEVPIAPIVDLNGDGKVDQQDVHVLLNNWGTNNATCDIGPTPFGDGIVDMQDLAVLTQYASDDVADPTLLACWKLDETEGTVAHECASLCDGKLVGSPQWRPQTGAVGGAIELDGVDDYVQASVGNDPSQGSFSVFMWVKGGKPGQVILSQAGGADWLVAEPSSLWPAPG